MSNQFQDIPLAQLVASRTNPRKHFAPDKLGELAESIKASGVHQPILVRPLPGTRVADTSGMDVRPTHEIVSGERRFRASQMADRTSIPAMIRDLTDDQVLEIQIVENLQRTDLTELEEAEGYDHLMQHSKISADDVGVKIGKSRSYVYSRLKLLDLSQECKVAMRKGEIDASRALLIARIPDGKLQLKALEMATKKDYYGAPNLGVRQFQGWLQQNVMLRLDQAQFKITDDRLVPVAGSCKDCPKRTGANPDLFADVESADICTDPACFQGKTSAHRDALIDKAEAKGLQVMSDADAKKVCSQYSSELKGYTRLSQKRNDIDGQSLGKLLGKDAPAPVLIEHPHTHELIEAVPTDEAEAVLLAKGLIKVSKAKENFKAQLQDKIEHLQKAAVRDITNNFREAAFFELNDAIESTPDEEAQALITPTLLRAWLLEMIDDMDYDEVADCLGFVMTDGCDISEQAKAFRLHVQNCHSAILYRSLARFLFSSDIQNWQGHIYREQREAPKHPLLDAMGAKFGLDLDALHDEVKADVRAELAKNIASLKADLKAMDGPKTPSVDRPAAQQKQGGAKGKKAAAKTAKLSAQEATQGIAAAMQGDEAAPADAAVPYLKPVEAWPFPGTKQTAGA